jgi:hypothetical protein
MPVHVDESCRFERARRIYESAAGSMFSPGPRQRERDFRAVGTGVAGVGEGTVALSPVCVAEDAERLAGTRIVLAESREPEPGHLDLLSAALYCCQVHGFRFPFVV